MQKEKGKRGELTRDIGIILLMFALIGFILMLCARSLCVCCDVESSVKANLGNCNEKKNVFTSRHEGNFW